MINHNIEGLVSLVICTRNRAHLLDNCLKSIEPQNNSLIPILIIDNCSDDKTKIVVNKWKLLMPNIKYIFESKLGLSNARNEAINQCKTEYLHYLDDDITLPDNFIESLLRFIETWKPNAYAGNILPQFIEKRPKWYKDEYLNGKNTELKTGILKNGFMMGGNMGFRTFVLKSIDGFPTHFGKGSQLVFGEETYVEIKLRQSNYSIHYCEEISVNHWTTSETLNFYLKTYYLQVKSIIFIYRELGIPQPNVKILFYHFKQFIKDMSCGLFAIFYTNYYWQNLIIDITKPVINIYTFLTLAIFPLFKTKNH